MIFHSTCITAVGIACVLCTVPDTCFGKLTQKALRARILKGINNHSLHLLEPRFNKPSDQDHPPTYGYLLGGRSDITAGKPLDYPVNLQCTIEALRKYRATGFWQHYLTNAETIIDEELKLISNHTGSRSDLMKSLEKLNAKGYGILEGAVKSFANSKGWQAEKMAMEPAAFELEVTTTPLFARVYYLSKWDYDTLLFAKLLSDHKHWNEAGVTQKESRSVFVYGAGSYHFRIIWPQLQKDYTSGVYKFDGPQDLTFSAHAVN